MMPLRSIVAFTALALQLCSCAAAAARPPGIDQGADQRRKAAIDEIERRHATAIENMGGGGGGGGSM